MPKSYYILCCITLYGGIISLITALVILYYTMGFLYFSLALAFYLIETLILVRFIRKTTKLIQRQKQ
jgi:hypothetical protein